MRFVVFGLALLAALGGAPSAWARAANVSTCRTMEYRLDEGGGALTVPIHQQLITSLHFAHEVDWDRAYVEQRLGDAMVLHRSGTVVDVWLRSHGREGELMGIVLHAPRAHFNLTFRVTSDVNEAVCAARIVDRSAAEVFDARVAAAVQLKGRTLDDQRLAELARRWLSTIELRPIKGAVTHGPGPLRLDLGTSTVFNEGLLVSFEVENGGMDPVLISGAELVDRDGGIWEVSYVHIQGVPAVGGEDGEPSRIPPTMRARGVALLSLTEASAFTSMRLALLGLNGAVVAWVQADNIARYPLFEPMTAEEIEIERRNKEALGRISLHLEPLFGAIWLADGMGLGRLDATSLRGLGARVTYGFNRFLAVEAALAGAWSGTAALGQVTHEGVTGELERSAALGRLYLGGVLRFGYYIIPLMRLGVAVQGMSHEGRIIAGADERAGPGELEWTRLFTVGIGLDFRLGSHLAAGVQALAAFPGERLQSLEVGAHVGVAW